MQWMYMKSIISNPPIQTTIPEAKFIIILILQRNMSKHNS